MHIFVAGASGVVGRRLVRRLLDGGHQVTATTTAPSKAAPLRAMGATVTTMDGLDARVVGEAVATASPDVVVHQMTALAGQPDFKNPDKWFAVTDRLRTVGTDNLLAAAEAVGVAHFVAQSFTGWPYARTGGWVKAEHDPLDPTPPAKLSGPLDAIKHLESAVSASPMVGTVLRYGTLYGPGVSDATVEMVKKRKFPMVGASSGMTSWLQIDDAVSATVVAVEHAAGGTFNIVDNEPAAISEWLPYMADVLDAKPPLRLPTWLARMVAGNAAVTLMTEVRGASNQKARDELGWNPRWGSWRDGFKHALVTADEQSATP